MADDENVAGPQASLGSRAAVQDFSDSKPAHFLFLGQHEHDGEDEQREQGVHQRSGGQHHDASGRRLGCEALGYGGVVLPGQLDEPTKRNQVDGVEHIRQLEGAAADRAHLALVPQQVINGTIEVAWFFVFVPLAVEFHLNGDKTEVFFVDGGYFYPLTRPEGLGAVESDEAGAGVQQYLGAPGVDAEDAGREADAELQHLDPDGAGGGEVAQLVDHHQNQQQRRKGAYGEQEGFHLWCPTGNRLAICRVLS